MANHVSVENAKLVYALEDTLQAMIERMIKDGLDIDHAIENTPEGEAYQEAKLALMKAILELENKASTK